jgi:hypothetical protein
MGRQVSRQALESACNGEKYGEVRARMLLVVRIKLDGVRPAQAVREPQEAMGRP